MGALSFGYPWYYYPLFMVIGSMLKMGFRWMMNKPIVRERNINRKAKVQ